MKRRIWYIVYFVAILVIPGCALFAQQVQVAARIDSTSMLIGNQTTLRLTAAYDAKNGAPKIQWPQIGIPLYLK